MKRLLFMCCVSLLIIGCSNDDDNSSYGGDPIVNTGQAIQISVDPNFGEILTDSEGNTLYFFANDAKSVSTCNDGCAEAWPPFYSAELTLGSGLTSTDFATVTRDDGSQQNTFKGFPLYTFTSDGAPGVVNGDGVGGVWYVAKADYAVMVVRQQLIGLTSDNETLELDINGEPGSEPTTYMTDPEGNTLYRFVNDNALQNNFTAEDFSNDNIWPIYASDAPSFPSLFDPSDFETIDVNGRDQLTYKGHPLYRFGQDAERGNNFGVGFPQPGIWYVLNTTTAQAEEAENTIQLGDDPVFGSILTNSEGYTLYFFANDAKTDSNCNGGCADAWPPFFVDEISWDSGLLGTDFTTIERADGSSQIAYKGFPLYLFANDTNPGDVNGDGAGGVWFVAKPDYAVMVAQQQLVGRNSAGTLIDLLEDGSEGTGVTKYITDDRGNTLYRFINDSSLNNTFTNEDFSNNGIWPIYASDDVAIPSIYDPADFQLIDVFGEPQLTFRGWPLYGFGQDETKGDTYGVGFPNPGVWFINNGNTDEALEGSSVIHNEDSDGYLSDAFDNPEGPFSLGNGNSIFTADQQGSPRDVDYFTITIPSGSELIALNLTGFVAEPGNQAFIGLVEGAAFPSDENSTTAGDLLGGKVFGEADLGSDILQAIGGLPGAQGFDGALPAGTYSIWLNQTGLNSEATIEFVIAPL